MSHKHDIVIGKNIVYIFKLCYILMLNHTENDLEEYFSGYRKVDTSWCSFV